jgi:hypothetical protein
MEEDNRKKDSQWGIDAVFASPPEAYSKRDSRDNKEVVLCQPQFLTWVTTPLEDKVDGRFVEMSPTELWDTYEGAEPGEMLRDLHESSCRWR